MSGLIRGGEQPVTGASISLYAAGVGGYGTAARSMLSSPITTDASGSFSITGDYKCQAGDQVYLVASGGNPGMAPGTDNAAITLAAALGSCSALSGSTYVVVNEVTTVAAAYALSGFMTSPTALASSGTPLAQTGVKNAFLTANSLVNNDGGYVYGATSGLPGVVPRTEINTLGNILAACVNSDGTGSNCSSLFAAATPPGGSAPSDTLQAILNIAKNPGVNVAALFNLSAAVAPFQPSLASAPNDWSVAVHYFAGPSNYGFGIDSQGNVWMASLSSLQIVDATGHFLSPSGGYSFPSQYPWLDAMALDSTDHAWIEVVTNPGSFYLGFSTRFSQGIIRADLGGFETGTFTGGGLGYPVGNLALSSIGNIWAIGSDSSGSLKAAEFASDGTALSPSSGYSAPTATGYYPAVFADTAGHIWAGDAEFASNGSVLTTGSPCGSGAFGGNYSNGPVSEAIDANGNIWAPTGGALLKCDSNGNLISPAGGFPTSGITASSIAVDGTNRIWFCDNALSYQIGVVNGSGDFTGTRFGYLASQNTYRGSCIAIDSSGDTWVGTDNMYLLKFVGIASPVVTPLAAATAANALGARP